MPELSSRLRATRWPPASSTATVSGSKLATRPAFRATSTMVDACASVSDAILGLLRSGRRMNTDEPRRCHGGTRRFHADQTCSIIAPDIFVVLLEHAHGPYDAG